MRRLTSAPDVKLTGEERIDVTRAEQARIAGQAVLESGQRQAGLDGPVRITAEAETATRWHYGVLLVRGGNPRDEFAGHMTLQATLSLPAADGGAPRVTTLNLPADQAEAAVPLTLKFKYYQRVEGSIRVPEGARLTALTAQVFENGTAAARASRSLTFP